VVAVGTSPASAERDHVAYASPSLKKLWADNQHESSASPDRTRAFLALAETSSRVVGDLEHVGVRILAGCDGLVPGFCLADELAMLVRSGLSPLAALRAATIGPAEYLGLERSHGAIERGEAADLVLLDDNPLEDIGNIRRIRAVVRNGTLLSRTDLDTFLQRVRTGFGTGGVLPAVDQHSERDDVQLAAIDYLLGFYEGDSARIAHSVRPDARKIGYFTNKNGGVYETEEMTSRK
jgi:amidohydrolase family protein